MAYKPDFRRATRYLISIGNEQTLITHNIDIIQGVYDASTRQAWIAARDSAAAAMRMARYFKSIAFTLEALDELER